MAEHRGRGAALALALAAVPPLILVLAVTVPVSAGASSQATATSESETTTASPTGTPSDPSTSPSPSDTVLPTATPTPTSTPSPTPTPSETQPSETTEPEPTETPTVEAPTIEPAVSDPRPAAVRAILTADSQTMTGLSFDGIVVHETSAGEVRALRFTADTNRMVNMRVDVTESGHTFRTTTDGTTVLSGDVVMDVTVFRARLLGVPIEFTPDAPPPLVLPAMTFTDVETHLVFVQADHMTVPGNNQTFVG